MQVARDALAPGYCLRAAKRLHNLSGTVIIGTGFPVAKSFETDGPVGAIALYNALETLGARPLIACGRQLARVLRLSYNVLELDVTDTAAARSVARDTLRDLQPEAVVSIESPGLAADGRYYNMLGEDITAHCPPFDAYVTLAQCPTIGIGDGGNEIGMGKIASAIAGLQIRASVTECDELLVADVSNWGAYGLVAFLGVWAHSDLLAGIDPESTLRLLSAHGSVDGVTRANTLTEDGLPVGEGLSVIAQLREATALYLRSQQSN
jgi:hypothetical protein